MSDKSKIIFNISGGTNQILPNATKAEQNFYGNQYMEEAVKKKQQSEMPAEVAALVPYINNVEKLSGYVGQLAACEQATTLAKIVVKMVEDPDVKVDEVEMVKERFICILQSLAPKVKTGVSNIRKRINDEWEKWKNQKRTRKLMNY
ncbi:MAG: hypothetical protein LKG14_07550 [Prevotella sp.]|jgi:hypothetical protein|uniref:Uncharacterized protein n=1 Tax=Segatella cerevisiae TaxID=2053716 RepID=A0ABT1BVW5_9BACT|nr:hypothetical protein [Segatella cerevisiae]MCH3993730.1 hypothetical protein [Prevotella sp.]MCI1247217.1 hypothetical protein [Prevotella sp.]MCO6024572.1 hypothetical protein [Segatella cerevisiae]